MGKDTRKYEKSEFIDIIADLGFEKLQRNGKTGGKGDHIVYVNKEYPDIKIAIPDRKTLNENEMSDMCSSLVLVMYILDKDMSVYTKKNGVEGKLSKTIQNSKKDIRILYTPFARRCLGLSDENDFINYINNTKEKLKETQALKKAKHK